jgi:hypothetical protein
MKILICTATLAESSACQAGLDAAGAVGKSFEVLRTGMGLGAAQEKLNERLLSGAKPDLIISSGFAGVWRGDFEVGTWITADRIWVEREDDFVSVNFKESKISLLPKENNCSFISVEKMQPLPIGLPDGLSEGALAVDMETASLAQIAETNGIPFSVFRMVTDTPENPLPVFVSTWSSAFLSPSLEDKLRFGAQGLIEAVSDFNSVTSFFKKGKHWVGELERGWKDNAQRLSEALQNISV